MLTERSLRRASVTVQPENYLLYLRGGVMMDCRRVVSIGAHRQLNKVGWAKESKSLEARQ